MKKTNITPWKSGAVGKKEGRHTSVVRCNICNTGFFSKEPHRLFCDLCRERDELFRFADWLPDGGGGTDSFWEEDEAA